jgi:ATPase subunit of ABC transporter with duplicated ATPase domains
MESIEGASNAPIAAEGERAAELESILRKNIKSKTLTDEAFAYMSELVSEDCPKNAKELNQLIGDFLTDGMAYSEEGSLKLCQQLQKMFVERKLIDVEQRDTIIAEKLTAPITISELAQEGHSGIVREDEFYDPLLAGERGADGNYNTPEDRGTWKQKKDAKYQRKMAQEQDALDKKINEFMATKKAVPPPRVVHDKSDQSRADIYLPNVTLIAGGKALLDKALVRFTRGRKYGLVGRNGIGKTTLINALCRKEIEKTPMNLHILQVEQEVVGDDVSVLDHVLECDSERLDLLKELEEQAAKDLEGLEPEDKEEVVNRITEINERL